MAPLDWPSALTPLPAPHSQAGDASYFYPTFGEASDLAFAFVHSFTVELLFGWPALAFFAFWEEASRCSPPP